MSDTPPTPAPPPASPAAPAPAPQAPPPPTPQPPPAATEKQPPWGKPENFDAEKAWELIQNLRTEKGSDPALRTELDQMKQAQQQQRDALASALGLKPEETSDADKLAQQVQQLQSQFDQSRLETARLTVAQNNGIPPEFQGWLTATDPETLDQQAKALLPMVQATLAARGQAPFMPGVPGIPPIPAFQSNPGQGQAGPSSPEAASEAEYQQYASRFNKQHR